MTGILDFFRRRERSSDASAPDAMHARVLGDVDGLAIQARHTLERCRLETPEVFDSRRDRRLGDRSADGIEGNEYTNTDLIVTGNADIECERGPFSPDLSTNTLPMYPKASDLPSGGAK